MKRGKSTGPLVGSILLLLLGACGSSDFVKTVGQGCREISGDGKDCDCIVGKLDAGLTEQQKAAFVPLRWPLRPDPRDREAVNGELLRAAGIDPADRRAVSSASQALRDRLHILAPDICAACGGTL